MTPDLQKEFRALRKDAALALRNIAESGSYHRAFTLIIEPSFHPSRSFTLYTPRRIKPNLQSHISQTIWRSDLDGEKFRDPVERLRHGPRVTPALEHDFWQIPEEVATSIMENLAKTFLLPDRSIVLDGINYELDTYSFRLKWREAPPASWRPFTEAVLAAYTELSSFRKKSVEA